MISCTEFIPAYSELFKFINKKESKAAVVKFWESLADAFLTNIKELVEKEGVRGYYVYSAKILKEEAADCRISYDPEKDVFELDMWHCPSKGRLLEFKHLEPCEFYCEHCAVLYKRVLEPLGIDQKMDLSKVDRAICREIVKRKDK